MFGVAFYAPSGELTTVLHVAPGSEGDLHDASGGVGSPMALERPFTFRHITRGYTLGEPAAVGTLGSQSWCVASEGSTLDGVSKCKSTMSRSLRSWLGDAVCGIWRLPGSSRWLSGVWESLVKTCCVDGVTSLYDLGAYHVATSKHLTCTHSCSV